MTYREKEPPLPFVSTEKEARLLCLFCRHRLGLGIKCLEFDEPHPYPRNKAQVVHAECSLRDFTAHLTSTNPVTLETVPARGCARPSCTKCRSAR